MIYVTVKQPPMYRQMTLEEFLFNPKYKPCIINPNLTNTRTYVTEKANQKLLDKTDAAALINSLTQYNEINECMRDRPRETLYKTFYTDKKGKGIPYVFKRIFAHQRRYVNCDASAAFRKIGSRLREALSQHPTELDEEIINDAVSYCTNVLTENNFRMTTDEFKRIVKESHRRIDAPKDELKRALSQLKLLFEDTFGVLYHTSAFAYIKKRSTIDAVKRHQANESKWFAKYDLSNFFGSSTLDFIMKMLSMIFPFSEIVKYQNGRDELEKALSLCVLNGALPQGTPVSPLITNIMMIPIDHKLSNSLRDFNNQRFIYTRYADDFLISSKYHFDFREVERLIADTLKEFEAPFAINSDKTRYGSSAGSNWNLGVMLNKDNNITVGYEKKRQFKAMVSSYVMDRMKGIRWDKSDVQTMEGYRNYYRMVEGETIDGITERLGKKFDVDIVSLIKEDLRVL